MIFLHQAGFETAQQAATSAKLGALATAPCPFCYVNTSCQIQTQNARMTPLYVADMYSLKDSDTEILKEFKSGNSSANKNEIPFSSIEVDQNDESEKRLITQNLAAMARFFLVTPELTKLTEQVHLMTNISTNKISKHHKLSKAAMDRQESATQTLTVIADSNPFNRDNTRLGSYITCS